MKFSWLFIFCVLTLALVTAATATAKDKKSDQPHRKPSTAAERERLVRIAKAVEQNPLTTNMSEDLDWARNFIGEAPDIAVYMCPKTVGFLRTEGYRFGPALEQLAALEGARFAIEHPENKDPNAQQLAMVEGTLRGYENLIKETPEAGSTQVEIMIAKRDSGTLAAFMKDACPVGPSAAKPQ